MDSSPNRQQRFDTPEPPPLPEVLAAQKMPCARCRRPIGARYLVVTTRAIGEALPGAYTGRNYCERCKTELLPLLSKFEAGVYPLPVTGP